jgi:predicted phosphodiesterase
LIKKIAVSAMVILAFCLLTAIFSKQPDDMESAAYTQAYNSSEASSATAGNTASEVVAATGSPTVGSTAKKSAGEILRSVINNFGKDPQTTRNFTWYTSEAYKGGVLQYCENNAFSGFDKSNIITVNAQSHLTKTNADKRVTHKVQLSNLKAGTEYVYRVGTGKGEFSSKGIFKTAEQSLNSFNFIWITDNQGSNTSDNQFWKNTLDKALAKCPDAKFLLHTGDMVSNGEDIKLWDLFADAVKEEFLNLPIVPVLGNHDTINNNKTNPDAKNFSERFNIYKEKNSGATAGTVYSFDYGDAHIAVMNSQCGSWNYKKQADWLKRDMSETNKQWKIVAVHRGPYGLYSSDDVREAWAPVFDELGIDLVLKGHDHKYARSFPIKDNGVVEANQGTVYITGNTSGNRLYAEAPGVYQQVELQPYTQMYVTVSINNRALTIKAYDVKDNLLDSFTMQK